MENGSKKISDTKKLRTALEELFLENPNKIYKYKELEDSSKDILGNSYSIGKLAGVVNTFVLQSKLLKIDKGIYKVAAQKEEQVNTEKQNDNHIEEQVNINKQNDNQNEEQVNRENQNNINDINKVMTSSLNNAIKLIKSDLAKVEVINLSETDFKVFIESRDFIKLLEKKAEEIASISQKEEATFKEENNDNTNKE